MKKLFFIAFASLVATILYAQDINLPTPVKTGGLSVMEALNKRQSTDNFKETDLTDQQLSNLLWAANGINRDNGKRTAPSALNSQDVDIYVALANGVYKYDAANLKLIFVSSEDCRKLAQSPKNSTLPPCMLYLVADGSKYPSNIPAEHTADMGRIDVGIVSQNISIFCAATGLGTRPRASMKQEELRQILKLNERQLLLLNHPIGYPL
ncbi:nitroreductase family protein [Dysgonomonas massiliensis]|uniref:nitroreductase family protein n=1 Tax=Dysgonomonas massiliensis TaxID=2040292 RepID=UPI000C75AE7E|nr:nitroreductase family protein [Dysgonomonas massiliensis]